MLPWNPKYGDRVKFKINETSVSYKPKFYNLHACLDEKVINELESELGSYLSEGDTKWV